VREDALIGKKSERLPSLQVFRGFASLLVVLFHLTWFGGDPKFLGQVFLFGHSGVDFFFVLSGFVITWGYGGRHGLRALGRYCWSRFARIYLPFWVALLLTVPFYLYHPDVNPAVLESGSLARNVLLYGTGPWLIPPSSTLAYELTFYIMFTLAFVSRVLWFVALLAWGALILYRDALGIGNSWPVWIAPYGLQFLLGVGVALACRQWRPRLSGYWVVAAGLACIVVGLGDRLSLIAGDHGGPWRFGVPYAALITTGAAYDLRGHLPYSSILTVLGEASYSIYLTHYYLLWLLNGWFGQLNFPVTLGFDQYRILTFAVTVGCGVAFWALVERPLLVWSRRLAS